MHQKEVLKEFTIVSRTIQHFVNRYSALIELKKYASRWTRMRRKISLVACPQTSAKFKKNRWISLNTSLKIGPMRGRSDFNEALTKLHRLHRQSGEVRFAPILSYKYRSFGNGIRRLLHPAHHGGNGTIPCGALQNLIKVKHI